MSFLKYLLKFSLCVVFCCNFAAAKAQTESNTKPQCKPGMERLNDLKAAQKGTFRALRLASEPLYLGNLQFQDQNGKTTKLTDFSGKMLLVNLWGVWCPPCRMEMPGLAQLQEKHGGKNFTVLTVHDQVSTPGKVRAFLKEVKAENLPLYQDADTTLYNDLKQKGLARGLPISLLVSNKGCLIASLNGGAPWGSEEAWYFINAAQKQQ